MKRKGIETSTLGLLESMLLSHNEDPKNVIPIIYSALKDAQNKIAVLEEELEDVKDEVDKSEEKAKNHEDALESVKDKVEELSKLVSELKDQIEKILGEETEEKEEKEEKSAEKEESEEDLVKLFDSYLKENGFEELGKLIEQFVDDRQYIAKLFEQLIRERFELKRSIHNLLEKSAQYEKSFEYVYDILNEMANIVLNKDKSKKESDKRTVTEAESKEVIAEAKKTKSEEGKALDDGKGIEGTDVEFDKGAKKVLEKEVEQVIKTIKSDEFPEMKVPAQKTPEPTTETKPVVESVELFKKLKNKKKSKKNKR